MYGGGGAGGRRERGLDGLLRGGDEAQDHARGAQPVRTLRAMQ